MARFVVTGCAGFIGSHVTRQLLDAGHTVFGVDSLNGAYDIRLKAWRLDRFRHRAGFDFAQHDLGHRTTLEALRPGAGAEAVFHLAARAGVRQSLEDPWVYLDSNAVATVNVLEFARRNDVATVVTASTSSLYGDRNPLPLREDANTDRPLSPYAASKKAAEAMAAAYAHLYGLNTPVPRFFTVYGPAGRPDMSIFRFVRWISEGTPLMLHGDGGQRRDFTFVEDIARGAIACAKLRGHEIINLGADSPHSLRELIALIEAETGHKAIIDQRPAQKADVPATWADISKARRLLGWQPETPIKDGIRATVAWYRENRALASSIDLGE